MNVALPADLSQARAILDIARIQFGAFFHDRIGHRNPSDALCEINGLALIFHHPALHPRKAFHDMSEQGFGQIHHALVIDMGPVELKHGEFGVVARRYASLRKLRLISYTFSSPPTSSRLRCNSGATRRYRSMSSAL